jgi:hypothetical protein
MPDFPIFTCLKYVNKINWVAEIHLSTSAGCRLTTRLGLFHPVVFWDEKTSQISQRQVDLLQPSKYATALMISVHFIQDFIEQILWGCLSIMFVGELFTFIVYEIIFTYSIYAQFLIEERLPPRTHVSTVSLASV